MFKTKLILVEGMPGSGKTTLAAAIKAFLADRGIPNRLFCEGDLNHPADFESVAHFTRSEFAAFLAQHSSYRLFLEQHVALQGDDCFLSYRQMKWRDIPDELIAALAAHDVYETPQAETYCRLARERWQAFVAATQQVDEISIFECCFLQNPLTVLLGKHNVAVPDAVEHIRAVAATVQPLRPILVYLWQQDARATLERVVGERPQEWKDFVIDYFTQQGWGKATRASGFEGVIAFYEMRKRIELDLLRQLDITQLLVDNTNYDWAESQRTITAFMSTSLGAV
jgi:hypothetical protein